MGGQWLIVNGEAVHKLMVEVKASTSAPSLTQSGMDGDFFTDVMIGLPFPFWLVSPDAIPYMREVSVAGARRVSVR